MTFARRVHPRSNPPWPAAAALALALAFAPGCWNASDSKDAGFDFEEDAGVADADATRGGDDAVEPDTDDPSDTGRPEVQQDVAPLEPELWTPQNVGLDWPGVGNSTESSFEIRNTGNVPVELTSVEVRESGDDEDELGLANSSAPTEIAPDDAVSVTIAYQPQNQNVDEGAVVVRADAEGLADLEREVPLEFPLPRVEAPQSVDFSSIPPGTRVQKDATLVNAGEGPLTLDDLDFAAGEAFSISFFDPANPEETLNDSPLTDVEWPVDGVPTALAPDEKLGVRIWFEPTDSSPEQGSLTFLTNDPEDSESTIELIGNSGSPCLGLSHENSLAFGPTPTGETQTRTVTIENCRPTQTSLEISNIEIADDAGGTFGIRDDSLPGDLADGGVATIDDDDRVSFDVTFTPSAEESYAGRLRIDSNDPARQEHDVELTGSGTDASCPTASARGRESGATSWTSTVDTDPLETVELDGSFSSDPDGSISQYQWSIIERPADSTTRLTPSSSATRPNLYVDVVGTYRVELKVYDDEGVADCGPPAVVEINAIPDDDLYAQLTWNTPADSDPTDDNGTDLDLHYLNTQGSWNQSPWDCFWHNKNPNWGDSGSASDDPNLVIDDTNGAGPESVRHDGHVSGQDYELGVYYQNDEGFGPSYASLRIYHQGQLEGEWLNKFLEGTGDFWRVAVFTGEPSTVYTRDTKYNGFP